ncbi:MAG: hypothetical protein JSV31_30705 [Desulfobacterales bacterium]|nr:MAG: hypothetical protein JSV31_30705 [Desulfobacterales bacterium]
MNASYKKIASGNYDKSDADKLFELAKKRRYPGLLAELAESFDMMIKVKVREFRLKQIMTGWKRKMPSVKKAPNILSRIYKFSE